MTDDINGLFRMITRGFYIFLLFTILQSIPIAAQTSFEFDNKNIRARLMEDVYVLASDSLQGRMTGSKGEEKAARYIINELIAAGVSSHNNFPAYSQAFNEMMIAFSMKNSLLINNDQYFSTRKDHSSFYPLAYSEQGSFKGELIDMGYGIIAPELDHDDYYLKSNSKGKIFLIETSVPGGFVPDNPFNEYRYLRYKMDLAIERGAKGVIFINSDPNYPNPSNNLKLNVQIRPIPVIFWNEEKEKLFNDKRSIIELELNIIRFQVQGSNIVAYIDNGGEKTVILGAHYDHLGMGDIAISPGKKKEIHPGADDNASGSAMILEMARYLNQQQGLKHNYLFLWFSGEEMGLHGSKSFARMIENEKDKYLCMLNFDMVGRSGYKDKDLVIINSGSSSQWRKKLKRPSTELQKIKKRRLAASRSDHSPFYEMGMPVLFFHTGAHPDYHTPNDLPDKINYDGMVKIYRYAIDLISEIEKTNEIPYRRIPLSNFSKLF